MFGAYLFGFSGEDGFAIHLSLLFEQFKIALNGQVEFADGTEFGFSFLLGNVFIRNRVFYFPKRFDGFFGEIAQADLQVGHNAARQVCRVAGNKIAFFVFCRPDYRFAADGVDQVGHHDHMQHFFQYHAFDNLRSHFIGALLYGV